MLRYGRRVCGHLATRPLYSWAPQPCCSAQSQSCTHTHIEAQARRVQDADRHRCITAHWRRRACPRPAAQKTQVSSSTSAACPTTTVSSAGRRGQLRIRKRTTPASASRNFVDSRARPARSRRPTDAAACHRPTPVAPVRRRATPIVTPRRAQVAAPDWVLPAGAVLAIATALLPLALKDGEEAAEEIFQQDESVRSLDSRKNRRV